MALGYHDAIALTKGQPFDLLICDIGLIDGDGCDLLHVLREQYHIDGIAMTGHGMSEDIERCRKAGFLTHLLKPISFDRLNAGIIEVLATKKRLVIPQESVE